MIDFGITHEHLLGKPTIHLPLNIIIQKCDDGKAGGVFQTSALNGLDFNSNKTHQLILADAFIRPRLVFHSDEFKGNGIAGLYTSAWTDMDKWINGGLLFDRNKG